MVWLHFHIKQIAFLAASLPWRPLLTWLLWAVNGFTKVLCCLTLPTTNGNKLNVFSFPVFFFFQPCFMLMQKNLDSTFGNMFSASNFLLERPYWCRMTKFVSCNYCSHLLFFRTSKLKCLKYLKKYIHMFFNIYMWLIFTKDRWKENKMWPYFNLSKLGVKSAFICVAFIYLYFVYVCLTSKRNRERDFQKFVQVHNSGLQRLLNKKCQDGRMRRNLKQKGLFGAFCLVVPSWW